MNIKISLDNLQVKLQEKNLIFVSGNVYETFLGDKGRELYSLPQKLTKIVKDKIGHTSLKYFSLDKGVIDLLSTSSEFEDTSLSDFLKDIVSNIHNKESSAETYIIDFGDVLMDNTVSGENGILVSIMEAISAILVSQNDNYVNVTLSDKQSKIVFIMRETGNIINYITNKNIEYKEVVINKPDANERKILFSRLASRFDVSDQADLRKAGKIQNEAVAITDGMSYKEILQLSRIKNDDEDLTFKELFNLSTLRKKESSWEQFSLEHVKELASDLGKKVFGQEYAVKRTVKTLKRSFLGLSGSYQGLNSNKPKGILFFCGPTGVGKTEMAKSITEFVFGDQNRMVRFDMSEFGQEHADQRLLGAPPGFVGFDGGGELTNAIKNNPNSIILFDEIEKAHPKIFDKFLQILEDGRLTSSKGELINFSETFIIFTSNIGSSKVKASNSPEDVRASFLNEVQEHFKLKLERPELLNRIGKENIVPFNFIINKEIQLKMLKAKLEKQNSVLEVKHNIKLVWNEETLLDTMDVLIGDKTYNPNDGGRGLLELATKHITDELVEFIIEHFNKIEANKGEEGISKIRLQPTKSKILFHW